MRQQRNLIIRFIQMLLQVLGKASPHIVTLLVFQYSVRTILLLFPCRIPLFFLVVRKVPCFSPIESLMILPLAEAGEKHSTGPAAAGACRPWRQKGQLTSRCKPLFRYNLKTTVFSIFPRTLVIFKSSNPSAH